MQGFYHSFEHRGECIPPYQRRRLESIEIRVEVCFYKNITTLRPFQRRESEALSPRATYSGQAQPKPGGSCPRAAHFKAISRADASKSPGSIERGYLHVPDGRRGGARVFPIALRSLASTCTPEHRSIIQHEPF